MSINVHLKYLHVIEMSCFERFIYSIDYMGLLEWEEAF